MVYIFKVDDYFNVLDIVIGIELLFWFLKIFMGFVKKKDKIWVKLESK